MKGSFARSAVIDHVDHTVEIDGVKIPWWMQVDGPSVEKLGELPVHVVNLPILVDGVVVIKTSDGAERIIDGELGDVAEWARDHVRGELTKRLPWLEL